MIDLETLLLFTGTSLVLLVTPGPAVLYVVAESLDEGRRPGIFAAAGLTMGNLVHALLATLGLSALLATSAIAFDFVRYVGAAYLLWLGALQIRQRWKAGRRPNASRIEARDATPDTARSSWRSFRRGLVVNTLNPKIALFCLAFFPQFVEPSPDGTMVALLDLGVLFVLLTLLVNVAYALTAGTAGAMARRCWGGRSEAGVRGRLERTVEYLPGLIYIGLGLAAALAPVERR